MTKTQAQSSIKKLNAELFSLTPASLVTLFEIDATDLALDAGLINQSDVDNGGLIFRFHNNIKIGKTSIIWNGDEYFAAPITAEGFEISAKGTLPTPRISLTTNEDGIPFLSILKEKIRQLNDLVGAKVTRIKTFAKYLDAANFVDNNTPEGFSPDPNTEFPRDEYYIDRKSNEDKYGITFELASILDVEGLQLPRNIVTTDKCRFNYRGCGCLYEYASNRVESIHGKESESSMPTEAPPVANSKNEKILDIIQIATITVKGKWQRGLTYTKGQAIFIEKKGIKYYFVCKVASTTNAPPSSDWVEDSCSRTVTGCKLRFSEKYSQVSDPLNGTQIKGVLPFGGYAGTNKAIG